MDIDEAKWLVTAMREVADQLSNSDNVSSIVDKS